ncbi:unnamed protein product [Ceutorhynchus assimilis]|uniref:Myb/SANT-like DNA-binding domain-containing protein n=1 Tax=Ceutorhynchus assimilis TaxID=467358 RepID=A0A9N9N156_9CUCU|nr:unnamed protein product [Ceutorhynchus assimilis]
MKELSLFDNEENLTYTLEVSDDEFDKIINENDLALATTLLEKHKEKTNLLAAFKIVLSKNSPNNTTCPNKELDQAEDQASSSHVVEDLNDEVFHNNNNDVASTETLKESRPWTFESTKYLIQLCEKYDEDFQRGVKRFVWNKVSRELEEKFNQKYSPQQCDTKFKGLKNMYKQVKKHNEQSGKSFKAWEYFKLMHKLLYSKPEINAIATCSSKSGLIINRTPQTPTSDEIDERLDTEEPIPSGSKTTPTYKSSFMRKRKNIENAVERRHKEKLERQDRYLAILDRLATAVENSTSNDPNKQTYLNHVWKKTKN